MSAAVPVPAPAPISAPGAVAASIPSTSTTTVLRIVPWPDPVIDRLGHDPRSTYVERFWLGILGPSTTWFLRRVADGLDREPDGFDLRLADTAKALGLGGEGRNSPFVRTLGRCCQFDMAQAQGDGILAVRRKVPPLSLRHLNRLPETLQEEHRRWQAAETGRVRPDAEAEVLHRRARQLALTLAELGEDLPAIERQLVHWRFHPSLAGEVAAWSWGEHQRRQGAVLPGQPPSPPAAA